MSGEGGDWNSVNSAYNYADRNAILSLQKKSPSWEKTSEFFKAYMNSIYEKR